MKQRLEGSPQIFTYPYYFTKNDKEKFKSLTDVVYERDPNKPIEIHFRKEAVSRVKGHYELLVRQTVSVKSQVNTVEYCSRL